MKRNLIVFIFLFVIFKGTDLYGSNSCDSESACVNLVQTDTLKESQILFNGRVWRNLYSSVKETQFLYSGDWLPGSVTMNGNTFNGLNLKYDIFTDEVITPAIDGSMLQLNKEMVDSFTMIFNNKSYRFSRFLEDSVKAFKGYVSVLCKGKTALYVKYKKEIDLLAVDDKYDLFFQTHKIYIMKDGVISLINSKKEFLYIMDDYKVQIRSYIKKNRLRITKTDPESFVPVVRFYNNLRQ